MATETHSSQPGYHAQKMSNYWIVLGPDGKPVHISPEIPHTKRWMELAASDLNRRRCRFCRKDRCVQGVHVCGPCQLAIKA